MKIRKEYPLENGIINLIGLTCTGGLLIIWAKETLRRDVEETEYPTIKPGKYEIKI